VENEIKEFPKINRLIKIEFDGIIFGYFYPSVKGIAYGKFKKIFEGSFDKISGGKNEIKREQLPDLMKEISKAVGKPEPSQHEIHKYMSEAKDAVIDKDRTSALLATRLKADILLILTTVEKVSINYKNQMKRNLVL